jgi:hypothetical protein
MPKPMKLKREEASERQAAHDKLSTQQKRAKVAMRRGASKREAKRLAGEK